MGSIRIIAGELKGRRIKVPDGCGVRPTPDRVREALFSILGEEIAGAFVLDAYSGSGALGFEALSRGAERILFVESDAAVAALLEANGERIGAAGRFRVIRSRMLDLAARPAPEGPLDVILADPPYRSEEPAELLPLISAPGWLKPGGLIVVERDRAEAPFEEAGHGFVLARTARYGRTRLDIYRRRD